MLLFLCTLLLFLFHNLFYCSNSETCAQDSKPERRLVMSNTTFYFKYDTATFGVIFADIVTDAGNFK